MAAGRAGAGAAALLVLGGVGLGLLWGCAWSAGQLLRPSGRRSLALSVGLGAALAVVPPPLAVADAAGGEVRDGAGTWSGPETVRAAGLAAAGAAGVVLCGALLGRARGVELAAQAARWEAATTTAASTDLAGAAGTFRALPTTGRRLRAIGAGPLAVLYARRDAVAWSRTPDRCAGGALGTALGAVALGGAALSAGPTAWAPLALGTLLLRAGAGAFVDGIRHGVHTLGAPPLLGQRAGTQLLLHAIAPGPLLAVLGAFGGLLARVTIGDLAGTASVLAARRRGRRGPRRAGPRGGQGHHAARPRHPDPDPAGRPLRAGHARLAGRRPRRADARRGRLAARRAGRSRGRLRSPRRRSSARSRRC
ncbi:hypothetical protein [Brachybacterium sp. GPGPB12]|uniref:hypothetical protein n=1 Tax=Brachybacterium sp. GPGPB12 TaxID=3023517 RepID=UPI0031343093